MSLAVLVYIDDFLQQAVASLPENEQRFLGIELEKHGLETSVEKEKNKEYVIDFIGYTLDLVKKELRMTEKNLGKMRAQIKEVFIKNQSVTKVDRADLEKFLGRLNFVATMTHLGRTKTFHLLKEFLAAKDLKD